MSRHQEETLCPKGGFLPPGSTLACFSSLVSANSIWPLDPDVFGFYSPMFRFPATPMPYSALRCASSWSLPYSEADETIGFFPPCRFSTMWKGKEVDWWPLGQQGFTTFGLGMHCIYDEPTLRSGLELAHSKVLRTSLVVSDGNDSG